MYTAISLLAAFYKFNILCILINHVCKKNSPLINHNSVQNWNGVTIFRRWCIAPLILKTNAKPLINPSTYLHNILSYKINIKNKTFVYKPLTKPLWTYGIQLWGNEWTRKLSFQSIHFRLVSVAPCYVTNIKLRNYLQIESLKQILKLFCIEFFITNSIQVKILTSLNFHLLHYSLYKLIWIHGTKTLPYYYITI